MAMEKSPIGDMFKIVFEQVNGQWQWMALQEPYARHLIRGIASGVDHLASLGIAHGDLKIENILMFWTNGQAVAGTDAQRILAMTPKLTDFNNSARGPPNGMCTI